MGIRRLTTDTIAWIYVFEINLHPDAFKMLLDGISQINPNINELYIDRCIMLTG